MGARRTNQAACAVAALVVAVALAACGDDSGEAAAMNGPGGGAGGGGQDGESGAGGGGAGAGGSDGGTASGDGGTTDDGGAGAADGGSTDGGSALADGGSALADGGSALADAGVGMLSSDCDVHCPRHYTTCFDNRCDGDAACVEERLQDCIARCEVAPPVPVRCEAEHDAWRACVLASAGADDCPNDPCDGLSAELGLCISGGRECLGATRWNHQKFDAFTDGDMLGRVWQSHCKCPTWPGQGEGGACGMVDEEVGPSAGGDCASHCCPCGDGETSFALSICSALVCVDASGMCADAVAVLPSLCE